MTIIDTRNAVTCWTDTRTKASLETKPSVHVSSRATGCDVRERPS